MNSECILPKLPNKFWPCRKNDSVFGHDMIGDADGFLSPSNDVIDSTAQSIPMPVSILVDVLRELM